MAENGFIYLGNLIPNLINLIPIQFQDLKRFWGFEDQLNHLRESLVALADLVEDAEQKQRTVEDARRWLRYLKEDAYEADDLLSELAYETTRFQVNSFSSVSRAINNVRKVKFRAQMRPKLKKVNQSLRILQRQCLFLQLSSIPHNLGDMLSENRLPTDSILGNTVVGRKTDVAKILNMLTSSYSQQLTVVSIVEERILGEMLRSLNPSMGGLTDKDAILSQLKIELVSKRFLLVLDDVWKEDREWWDLFKTLLSRICTNNGNAILVTTRSSIVSFVMETSPERSYRLNRLSNDECWFILKERAFREVAKPITSILEVIGREIAAKCVGMPLLAKVLGVIMGFNRDEDTWLKIRDGTVFDERNVLHTMYEQIVHHLPWYLKPCFASCSIFPKNFLIRKEELIWLWMAEGIVESYDMGSKCFDTLRASFMFQDAETDDYDDTIICKMHDLVHDLILSVYRNEPTSMYRSYGDDQFLKDSVHTGGFKRLRTIIIGRPLNREIGKMKRLRSLHFNAFDMPSSIRKRTHLRYLDVSFSKTKELSQSIKKLYNLQILNLSNSSITTLPEFTTKLFNLHTLNLSKSSIKELPKSISKLQSLQTLNVSNSNIKELPESINKLHKLQTLDVSNSNIKELPESITELYNLQNLKFLECKELAELPRTKINKMASLKHIAFSYEHQMPVGLGKLCGLETLLYFVVGLERGGSIEELQFLNKLRGKLKITRLEDVADKEEAERANLQQKAQIQGLCFEWSYGANDRSLRDEELLEGLQPHSNIERMKIKYYMGEKWPSWMLRMKNLGDADSFLVINNLVDLTLEQCWNCVQLPRLGDLPHLKFLKMSHMGKVKRISNEFYGIDSESRSIGCLRLFPALESLSISRMENLTEWSSPSDRNKVVVFPCLENLCIQSCPKLSGFPISDLSELVNLEIRDCEELRLLTVRQQSFASFTSLSIVGCSKFTYLRNWLLCDTCFMELSVRRCEWLMFIPEDLGKVICLTSLEIYGCKRLRFFPEEILLKLTRLQRLSIGAFSEELDSFRYLNGVKDLPCLEELEIWGSDLFGRKMYCLPNQLQHCTVLKSLKIIGFTTMEEFPGWLTNLQSLQSLSLDYCRHLGCQSTTTIIRQLSNLTHLNINCCPFLEESKSAWLPSLDATRIKVELSHVSEVRVRLGY